MKHTLSALALASLTAGAFAQSAPAPVAATASDLAVRGGISWSGDDALGRLDVGIQRSAGVNAKSLSGVSGNNGFTLLDSNREIYVGQSFKSLPLAPVATVYYSTDLKELTIDIAASKTFKGAELGIPGFDIVVKANLGLSDASDANGDLDVVPGAKVKNSYSYLGASVDVTRAVGQGAVVGAGLNYAYNTDGQTAVQNSAAFLKVFANFKF